MVGIVLVSHSAKLAEGIQELARQMVQAPVTIAIAAGIDDPENPFGTDVIQIHAAIESVYSDAGVMVLMDLGSAVMGAEMALEFLPEDQRSNVKLCEAPLVEGAIAAIVQAAAGADIEQVIAEARGALAAKVAQLSGEVARQGKQGKQGKQEIRLIVRNQLGIHARPAAQLITTAGRFQADITIRNLTRHSPAVSAKSINQVVTLGVLQGHEIAIAAQGIDAQPALAALQQLVADQFDEVSAKEEEGGKKSKEPGRKHKGMSLIPSYASLNPAKNQLYGISASPGIAIGPAILYQPSIPEAIDQPTDNPQAEWRQLQLAIQTAQTQIQAIIQTLQVSSQISSSDNENASIFKAHLLYLNDPVLRAQTHQIIFDQHRGAAIAWKTAIAEMVKTYQTLEDSYLQARAADVQDVGWRVLRLLTQGDGEQQSGGGSPAAGILVASDLTPSDAAQLRPDQVLGICTVAGNATAHSALIANMLGIPMVVGVGERLLGFDAGVSLALDGATGQIWIDPSDAQRQALKAKQSLGPDPLPHSPTSPLPHPITETFTRDGQRVSVMANIMGLASAQTAWEQGAAGVGLLWTEFLYLDRVTTPTEAEQVEIYQAIAAVLGARPLTIRTVDIGGDKPIPYMRLGPEANPFLGWRGIRQSLDCPDMLRTQLRAILRASHGHTVQVMFPMVASAPEVRAAKVILTEAQDELRQAGIPFDPMMKVGIMIEVPAAVTMADQLAAEVDFFSLGTNDLSQYAMAADRTNPQVSALADALEPAVLRMVQHTVRVAHEAGIEVRVCGQLASDPVATPILLGLGIDELSVNPPAIAAIKGVISQWSMAEASEIAAEVLQLDSAAAVREYVSGLSF